MANTNTKTYTVGELARIAGVKDSSMSTFLQKHNLKPTKTGKYNRKYFESHAFDVVMQHYKNKAKSETKTKNTTKEDVIAIQQRLIDEQGKTIELLREQLSVKDRQIETANRLADQAQQLDLTTHNQQKELVEKTNTKTDKDKAEETTDHHGWWWRITH